AAAPASTLESAAAQSRRVFIMSHSSTLPMFDASFPGPVRGHPELASAVAPDPASGAWFQRR
ncbi:hypothetical protein, partial [Microbispora sp. NPDC049633]|uniref:hypothetical protein n=1 Tax=Microbispora sp. NPDC049633 TaxID=3154355 RepID=UPI003433912B